MMDAMTTIRPPTDQTDQAALVALVHAVMRAGYDFVTTTPATHARVLARHRETWARSLRDVFGWSRPYLLDTVPTPVHDAALAAGAIVPHADGWRSLVRISTLDGMPFLHSAFPTVTADSVFFGPDTYRFAQAIGTVLDRPVRRAVDVGTGAGPGAVLISKAKPEAEVFGADINPAALRLAEVNATVNGVSARMVRSDILSAVPGNHGDIDLMVANPPYMADPARRAYRDGGGALGADLSLRIVDAALSSLAPGGTLLLYTGAAIIEGRDPFLAAVEPMLAGAGCRWTYREMDPDVFGEELEDGAYAGADRIAAVVLTAATPI